MTFMTKNYLINEVALSELNSRMALSSESLIFS